MHVSRLLPIFAGSLLLACSCNGHAAPPPHAGPAGMLVTASGQTLYTYDMDRNGQSDCNGSCASVWPPYAASKGATAAHGLTTISRADGSMQWAWHGQPLYLYAADQAVGDTKGDDVNGVWHIVRQG